MSVIFCWYIVVTKLPLFDLTAARPNYFNGINCTDQSGGVACNSYYSLVGIIAKCVMCVLQSCSIVYWYILKQSLPMFYQKKKEKKRKQLHEAYI